MAGRPRREISDDEILAVIDKMHETDDSVSKICKELKLSTAQYYDALEKNPIFKRLHVHAHTERAEKCVDQIHEALQELKDKTMDPSSARVYIDTKKWEAPDLERQFIAFWNKWRKGIGVIRPNSVYIEDKAIYADMCRYGLFQRVG